MLYRRYGSAPRAGPGTHWPGCPFITTKSPRAARHSGACRMNIGRVNPNRTLDAQGIVGAGSVHYNLIEPALVEEAVRRGEGRLGRGGAFLCTTGQFTGRSPKDKFVVRTPSVENTIWWENNAPMAPEAFARLKADMLAHVKGRELFV